MMDPTKAQATAESAASSLGQNTSGPAEVWERSDVQPVVFSCPVDHRGATVHVKGWVRSGSTLPPLLLVHDLGEHIGFYRPLALRLVEAGYSVYGFDLRGHGLSGPSLGHIPDFGTLVTDLLQVVAWIRFKSARRIPVLIGQGIGALMAMHFQRTYPNLVQGLALCAPYLSVRQSTSAHKRLLIRILAEMMPRARLPKKMVPAFLARFTSVTELGRIGAQPFHGITANFAHALLGAINNAPADFNQVNCPTLMLCPEFAAELDLTRLQALCTNHPHRHQITLHQLEGAAHHALTEPGSGSAAALSILIPWLQNIGAPP